MHVEDGFPLLYHNAMLSVEGKDSFASLGVSDRRSRASVHVVKVSEELSVGFRALPIYTLHYFHRPSIPKGIGHFFGEGLEILRTLLE